MSTHVLKVNPADPSVRLDVYLTQNLPDQPTRSYVKKLLETDCVRVDGKSVKAHYKVHPGQAIEVILPQKASIDNDIHPEDIRLDVFYEDDALVIINKPSGMIVHPAQGCYTGTLVNALLHRFQSLSDFNAPDRPGIVHRLDQETSGLLIVAKNNKTHALLAKQFNKHKVYKKYIALVEGEINFEEGLVDAPLGRHLKHREKKAVQYDEGAKDALTYYSIIKRHHQVTLVSLFPKTGRTHQLRVHMAHLGHPILGDSKYGKKDTFFRLALHAQAIGFVHPQTRQYVEFSLNPPPEFFKKVGMQ